VIGTARETIREIEIDRGWMQERRVDDTDKRAAERGTNAWGA